MANNSYIGAPALSLSQIDKESIRVTDKGGFKTISCMTSRHNYRGLLLSLVITASSEDNTLLKVRLTNLKQQELMYFDCEVNPVDFSPEKKELYVEYGNWLKDKTQELSRPQ